jgi:putative flavoprotein involved in K+ transport
MQSQTVFTPVLVIGGGQAGLAMGYHLAKRGIPFQILDANPRTGDAWRNRWDSLKLFTPARYVGLPGFPFPAPGDAFPTKEEMADYMERYAGRFRLPIRHSARVTRLSHQRGRFVAETDAIRFEADQAVVAMADYQVPKIPDFAADLDPSIVQVHSNAYRNPAQLQEGGVLVVGVGNSGADIAIEVARTHPTWLAGRETGHVPFPIGSFLGRNFLIRIVRFIGHHVLSVSTPLGRKLRPDLLRRAAPLIRVRPEDLARAGVGRVPRVEAVRDGKPLLAGGRSLDVKNVIWCTGYRSGFSWIDLPVFGPDGRPRHDRGVVASTPGLYFVGLHFLYSMTSATLVGVGRDAARIAAAVQERTRAGRAA